MSGVSIATGVSALDVLNPSTAAAVVGAALSHTGDGPPQIILPSETLSFVSTFAWSSLPAAADYIGVAYVSDVGAHGSYWQSNGATWGVVGGAAVLYSSAVAAVAHTGTTAETTIASLPIQGGLLGMNGAVEIKTRWSVTNNANQKIQYIRFDSTAMGGVGMPSGLTGGLRFEIQNRNSQSAQLSNNGSVHGYATQTTGWATAAFNTANAFNLNINMALSNAADSATLESYQVKLIRP